MRMHTHAPPEAVCHLIDTSLQLLRSLLRGLLGSRKDQAVETQEPHCNLQAAVQLYAIRMACRMLLLSNNAASWDIVCWQGLIAGCMH